jgi:hypothetical protein
MEFEFGTRSGHVLIGLLSIEALDVDGELCPLAVIRDLLRNRKEQLLRAAFLGVARNEATVTNYFARQVLASTGKLPAHTLATASAPQQ